MKYVDKETGLVEFGIMPTLVRQLYEALVTGGDEAGQKFVNSLSDEQREQLERDWMMVEQDRDMQEIVHSMHRSFEVQQSFLGYTTN